MDVTCSLMPHAGDIFRTNVAEDSVSVQTKRDDVNPSSTASGREVMAKASVRPLAPGKIPIVDNSDLDQ